jgi:hypothetical protein
VSALEIYVEHALAEAELQETPAQTPVASGVPIFRRR